MNDIIGYNERMKATMEDKMWFISKLPDNIDTIIDFGCADCSLAKAINEKYPGRFKIYFGIDNNREMLRLGNKTIDDSGIKFPIFLGSSFDEIGNNNSFVPERTVLVLNSVIHEIFNYKNNAYSEECNFCGSYDNCLYFKNIINKAYDLGINCIAIRDMYSRLYFEYNTLTKISILEQGPMAEAFNEYREYFESHFSTVCPYFVPTGNYMVYDFLMKWFYKDNWDREMKEFYFWGWLDGLMVDERFPVKYVEQFNIPYVVNKAKELGIDMTWNTHAKLLLMRNSQPPATERTDVRLW